MSGQPVVPSQASTIKPPGLSHLNRRSAWVEVGEQSGRVLAFIRPALRTLIPAAWLEEVRLPLRGPEDGNPFPRERLRELATSIGGFLRPDAGVADSTVVWQFLRHAVQRGLVQVVAAPRREWQAFTTTALMPTRETVTGTAKVSSGTSSTNATLVATSAPPATAPALPTTWIEISLVGDDDRSLGKEPYRLTLGDGQVINGRFDERGSLYRSGLEPGTCRFTLPEVDQAAWETVAGGGAEALSVVGGSGRDHRITEGESTSNVAATYGFAPDTVWSDADNGQLTTQRAHPNLLLPGDVLAIPDRRRKELTLSTDQVHTFKRTGARTLVVLRVFDGDAPRANQSWKLVVGNHTSNGTSDGDGVVELWVAPSERSGTVTIGADELELQLAFDHLHPVSEVSGVRQRLHNLGFGCDLPDLTAEENLTAAVRSFQVRLGLDPTGEIDDQVRQQLTDLHDRRCTFPAEPAIKHKA